MTKWNTGMQLRPQDQGTKGHLTHCGEENQFTHYDLSQSFIFEKKHLQSDHPHLGNLSFHWQKGLVMSQISYTLTSMQVKCCRGTYWGVDGRHFFFPEVQPRMRKRTNGTGCEKSTGQESHAYIQMSEWSEQHHSTEISHWSPASSKSDIHKSNPTILFFLIQKENFQQIWPNSNSIH